MTDKMREKCDRLRELIDHYWDIGWSEGLDARNYDSKKGAAQDCRSNIDAVISDIENARAQSEEPVEVHLGQGDKLIADIHAYDGNWSGIGIFQPEDGAKHGIGDSDGRIDGEPLENASPLILIKSDCTESLGVLSERIEQAIQKMKGDYRPPAREQVPEGLDLSWIPEMLEEYADALREGLIDGAGRPSPSDIQEQADLLAESRSELEAITAAPQSCDSQTAESDTQPTTQGWTPGG